MKKSACVVIIKDGFVLTVSRKDNYLDIGLPGGKVDFGETIEAGAIRECLEETGYTVSILKDGFSPFVKNDGMFEVTTFIASINEDINRVDINEEETGIVDWKDPRELLEGTFSEYNTDMLMYYGLIKKYVITYNGPGIVDDIVLSTSKTEAIKDFIKRNKGRFNVLKCEELIKTL